MYRVSFPRPAFNQFRCVVLAICGGICVTCAPMLAAETSDGPWRYTTVTPPESWSTVAFDDREWKEGFGGFGEPSTPGARVATRWTTDDIWLRRYFDLAVLPGRPALWVHHDETAEIFINGQRVAHLPGYTTQYTVVALDKDARKTIAEGRNLLAVHCHQSTGGQFIDVHVIDESDVPTLPAPQRTTVPFKSDLITKWGEQITSENVWSDYPRPQLVRDNWQNLNGLWDYAITRLDEKRPSDWNGKILVPFCLESKLSGVQRLLNPTEALWYRRTIHLRPKSNRRTILNFEAVDYECRAWLNDVEIGQHVGGHVPFQFDVSKAVRDGINQLVIRVEDATGNAQLCGKQRLDPSGIWYTRVSGIWQTVWLEEVPSCYVERVQTSTDIHLGSLTIRPILGGESAGDEQLQAVVLEGDQIVAEARGPADGLTVTLPTPQRWSPDDPHLYGLRLHLLDRNGNSIDQVESYAGLRDVGRKQDAEGHWRFTLNGEFIFPWGTLDQGWWPDGLLTPPSDEAMRSDIEFLKSAGFNMIRKHIKVEPRRYYFHCDRLGMMLWQDHVSGGPSPEWTRLVPEPDDAPWSVADHTQFMAELAAMVDHLENHPAITVWVPFNEAWGQHRTLDVGRWMLKRDPTRLINIASGGNFWPVGHIVDAHNYPHPAFPSDPARDEGYIKVLGEFGGHGWPIPGHLYDNSRRNWGYGGLPRTLEEYKDRYRESIRLLTALKAQGIAAGVYTQTTDVEGEINGLLTYDRKVAKIPAEQLRQIHAPLLAPGSPHSGGNR